LTSTQTYKPTTKLQQHNIMLHDSQSWRLLGSGIKYSKIVAKKLNNTKKH